MVQPLEIADTLSKTELVRKFKQIQKAASEMDQRQAASILKEKKTTDPERTKESEKSDLLVITGEKQTGHEKKGPRKDASRKKEQNRDDAEKESPEHLDLKA
jgi:hypothetical protein